MNALMPFSLNECYMQLSCEESAHQSALASWWDLRHVCPMLEWNDVDEGGVWPSLQLVVFCSADR